MTYPSTYMYDLPVHVHVVRDPIQRIATPCLRKRIINNMGSKHFYSRFETCFATSTFRCWVQNTSQITIFWHHLTKGSDVGIV